MFVFVSILVFVRFGFLSGYSSALIGFGLVFSSASAVTLFAVFSAFSTDPRSAGFVLLCRLLPGFFAAWVTGFVADFGFSSVLARVMLVVGVVMVFVPLSWSLLAAGVLTAYAEVSVGALLAPFANVRKAAHIGLAYDVAKFGSAVLAAGLFFVGWFEFVVLGLTVVGVLLLSSAFLVRSVDGSVFVFRSSTFVPAFLAGFVSLGVGSFLWVQGFYAGSLLGLAVFAGVFGVAATVGNLVLVFVVSPGWFSVFVGAVFQVLASGCLVVGGFGVAVVGMVFLGFGAALFFQSLSSVVLRTEATGRDQAVFTTSIRVCVAVGGVLLSWFVTFPELVLVSSAVVPLLVLVFVFLWCPAVLFSRQVA